LTTRRERKSEEEDGGAHFGLYLAARFRVSDAPYRIYKTGCRARCDSWDDEAPFVESDGFPISNSDAY
jgi:hypothetical protein